MDGRSVVATLALTLAVSVPGPAQAAPPASAAPPVSLSDRDGRPVRLADLLGRVLVVDFWASWCGPCKQSFPALDELYAELHARGLEVLAVSVDESRKDADAFLAAHPHRMTVLFDPQAKAAEAFGVDGMPSTFVIDRQGRVRSRHEGYTPGVTDAIRRQVEALLAEKGAAAASASPR
jgi:peroxiredoxin